MTPHLCSRCRRDMTDPVTGTSVVGIEIELKGEDAIARRVYPELTFPLLVRVCVSCWLSSLGIEVGNLSE